MVLAAAIHAGCGSPGIPLPPSLELARPVTDLRATRKGNRVFLSWSVPVETTDHHRFRHTGPTEVCRSVEKEMAACGKPVGKLPPPTAEVRGSPTTRPPAAYKDALSSAIELASPTSMLVYAVNVLNSYGRSAALSNQASVPAAPTLDPPRRLEAQLSSDGVKLSWDTVEPGVQISGLRYRYRIYRRELPSGRDAIAGEVPVGGPSPPTIVDRGFEWEKTCEYRATVVTFISRENGAEEQVEGDDSRPVSIFAHDIFPPAEPTGLEAVSSNSGEQAFIDLVWPPNLEQDLAGYNVFRHETGGPAVKLNSALVKQPAFRDAGVVPGHEYFYSVSAVDVRGNESPRSQEAHERVPAP